MPKRQRGQSALGKNRQQVSERDKNIIKAYLARRTLIEAFSEEAVGEE